MKKPMLFSLFESALDAHTAVPRQIALALSGGLDSRVMLDLLASYRDIHPQHDYVVIHVHHGLSPHADNWLAQCELWSQEAGFRFLAQRVTLEYQGESLEKVAREARYQAIEAAITAGALLLTAQHADDQSETFLLALKRGSGPAGLAAMPSVRPLGRGELLRPFLQISRNEIEQYALSQGLNWVDDESNLDCRFDRNFIRHTWLPLAQQRWPGITKAINRAASLCAEQEALLDELLSPHDKQVRREDGGLSITALKGYSLKMQLALVRRWCKYNAAMTLSQAQLQQVFHCVIDASQDANPKITIKQWQIRRFQDRLYLVADFIDVTDWQGELITDESLELPDKIGLLTLTRQNDSQGLQLTLPESGQTVRVHFNSQGILAHPLGRQGRRKLKKLFHEYGIPSWQRKRTPLIFYGDKLAAVADLFVCNGFEGNQCQLIWHKK